MKRIVWIVYKGNYLIGYCYITSKCDHFLEGYINIIKNSEKFSQKSFAHDKKPFLKKTKNHFNTSTKQKIKQKFFNYYNLNFLNSNRKKIRILILTLFFNKQ